MTRLSLQQKMDRAGGPLAMMRTSQAGPYAFPIPPEFSNWRDEQRAWREGVALMDQSFHMTDLYLEGPDAHRLVSSLAINSFTGFGDDKAKQFIACAPSGHLVGDMIIFGLGSDLVNIVGRPTVANWVEFHAGTGSFDVQVDRDERTLNNPRPRKTFRYEIQGPLAWQLIEKLNGAPLAQPKFFAMGKLRVAGRPFRSLRHGMGGAPGLEFWGPLEQGAEVKAAILAAGEEFGLRQVGSRAYASAAVDSGWLPCPLPAIYSSPELRAYREWLGADSFDAIASLGGSFVSDRIEGYYYTPWDLDYGRLIRFDHDFIGRAALERLEREPHRRKVSLVWNPADAQRVYASLATPGRNGKYMEMPAFHYSSYQYDAVLSGSGERAGIATYSSFLAPDGAWVSLAVIDETQATVGNELTILWGEPDGGSSRPNVERHVQMEVRATVSGWPFSVLAQQGYRPA
jgi:syringate O-demethylase/vanillate/3-O-methylgallate O-demethylase